VPDLEAGKIPKLHPEQHTVNFGSYEFRKRESLAIEGTIAGDSDEEYCKVTKHRPRVVDSDQMEIDPEGYLVPNIVCDLDNEGYLQPRPSSVDGERAVEQDTKYALPDQWPELQDHDFGSSSSSSEDEDSYGSIYCHEPMPGPGVYVEK
jgi:hypothetical protein